MHGNIHLYFVKGELNEYRQQAHFIEFQETNRQFEEDLTKDFTKAWTTKPYPPTFDVVLEKFYPRLYQAYKLMRIYVSSDSVLFT